MRALLFSRGLRTRPSSCRALRYDGRAMPTNLYGCRHVPAETGRARQVPAASIRSAGGIAGGRAPALDMARDPGCSYADPGGIRKIERVTETMSRRGATSTANLMALMCVADSRLREFWEGRSPVTRTGDYSDVMAVDTDGRLIPWQSMAHLDADEMGATMREIAERLYTDFAEPRECGVGGAQRSSPRHKGLGRTQGGPRPEEADGRDR